jgi:hypothetical protein
MPRRSMPKRNHRRHHRRNHRRHRRCNNQWRPVWNRLGIWSPFCRTWAITPGASETYAGQLESSKDQAKALADGARALARNPEKLSASLELFFRIEGLENMLESLVDALRKYQGQQAAQQLAIAGAEGGANRERLRRYIVNLAAQREQQFEAMDREAQRCRGVLAQPGPPTSGRKK